LEAQIVVVNLVDVLVDVSIQEVDVALCQTCKEEDEVEEEEEVEEKEHKIMRMTIIFRKKFSMD
jgi:hypothetical protein